MAFNSPNIYIVPDMYGLTGAGSGDYIKAVSYTHLDVYKRQIRILCACTKDRSSDYLKNIIIKEAAMGKVPEILDVALDKHTRRGQEMGRGSIHFFEEGAKVIPQLDVDNGYKERYRKILENYDPSKAVPGAFVYSSGRD